MVSRKILLCEVFWFNIIHSAPRPLSCRVVRNSNYGWRALRLLSRRSPHFFQPTNQQFKSLADYLESMVIKLAKELPVSCLVWLELWVLKMFMNYTRLPLGA